MYNNFCSLPDEHETYCTYEYRLVSLRMQQWFSMFTPGRLQLAERHLDPGDVSSPQQQTPASAFNAERVLRAGDGGAVAPTPGNKVAAHSSARATATATGSALADKGYTHE